MSRMCVYIEKEKKGIPSIIRWELHIGKKTRSNKRVNKAIFD